MIFHYRIVRVFENTWFYEPQTWVEKIMRFWKEQQAPKYHYSVVLKTEGPLRVGDQVIFEHLGEPLLTVKHSKKIFELRSLNPMEATTWPDSGQAIISASYCAESQEFPT